MVTVVGYHTPNLTFWEIQALRKEADGIPLKVALVDSGQLIFTGLVGVGVPSAILHDKKRK